jgi:type III secretion protein W
MQLHHPLAPQHRPVGGAPPAVRAHAPFQAAGGAQTLALAVLDPMSLLSDSADELSQSLSSRVQERTLKERRVSSGSNGDLALSRARLQELQRLLQGGQGDGGSQDEAAQLDLARNILRQPGQARQQVQARGDDPSGQYLSLLEVAALIREGAAGADAGGVALAEVEEAAARLLAEHGEAIRADMNSADTLSALATPEEVQGLRSAYRDAVIGQPDLASTLRHVLDAASGGGADDYLRVLDTLRNALGADLAATQPSTEPARLQSLVSDLYQLKVIGTVVEQGSRMSQTLAQRHAVPPFKGTLMASELVALTGERWVDASRFTRVAERCGAARPTACAVDFLTGLRHSLRDLPPQVFASPDARQSLLDTAQQAVDAAIDREELE